MPTNLIKLALNSLDFNLMHVKNLDTLKPDPIYCPENILLYEALYGKNLISIGGFAAIENMFSDIEIRRLKALDLGFGLGGVAFYLAQQYQMSVHGLELHPWMVQYALKNAPKEVAHRLHFNVYSDNGELPYETNFFDLTYSKGVLNHVHEKEELFQQINRVLKPAALFVIADWVFPELAKDKSNPIVCETKQSYEQVLKATGFDNVTFRDDSEQFLGYIKLLQNKFFECKTFIEKQYGVEFFSIIKQQHEDLIDNISHKGKQASRIIARKAV